MDKFVRAMFSIISLGCSVTTDIGGQMPTDCLLFAAGTLGFPSWYGSCCKELFLEKPIVNRGAPTPPKAPIFYEILAYFADHPQAQDTVEGIVEWWLLEQRIKRTTTQVKTALTQLEAEELVIPREGTAGRIYYRVNRQKLHDIRRILKEKNKEK